jgi:hypothetical protein
MFGFGREKKFGPAEARYLKEVGEAMIEILKARIFGLGKKIGPIETHIMAVLKNRDVHEEWMRGMEIFDVLKQTAPGIGPLKLYVPLQRLSANGYIEKKVDAPFTPDGRGRAYYRATRDSPRVL